MKRGRKNHGLIVIVPFALCFLSCIGLVPPLEKSAWGNKGMTAKSIAPEAAEAVSPAGAMTPAAASPSAAEPGNQQPDSESAFQEQSQQPAPFTANELKTFVKDIQSFADWAALRQIPYEQLEGLEQWRASPYWNETSAFLQRIGWIAERFFYVFAQLSAGLTLLQLEDSAPGFVEEIAAQQRMIRESPDIPEEEKQILLMQLAETLRQTSGSASPFRDVQPQEMDLIRANRTMLLRQFTGANE